MTLQERATMNNRSVQEQRELEAIYKAAQQIAWDRQERGRKGQPLGSAHWESRRCRQWQARASKMGLSFFHMVDLAMAGRLE